MSNNKKSKRKKIFITLGAITASATPTSFLMADIITRNKGDTMPQKVQDEIDKIKDLLKGKVNKAVMVSLISQLENFLAKPNDKDTVNIVRAVLAALKSQIQNS